MRSASVRKWIHLSETDPRAPFAALATRLCIRSDVAAGVMERNRTMRSAYLLVGALALAACSSSSSSGGTTGGDSGTDTSVGGDPTIKITKPTTGAALTVADLTDGTDLMITYTATNFNLKSPGTCAGAQGCGHIHVYV